MVINSVNAAAPEIYGNRSAKKAEETARGSFAEAISDAMSENVNVKTNADIAEFSEAGTGKISVNGSYTVTEEQAAEIREKYGESYDEDKACKLYEELAENGIIDINYTTYASGYTCAIPLTGLKCRGCFTAGGRDIYNLGGYCTDYSTEFVSGKIFIKDVSHTDEDAYKYEWDSFKKQYDREINTWQDALQEKVDFERYLKEIAANSTSGKHYPSAESSDRVIEGLEKIKDVIFQIFG